MPQTLTEKVQATAERLQLSREDLASITGTSSRSVARYLAGDVLPQRMTRQRLLELNYVAEQIAEVLKPEDANLWLFAPNRGLNHDTPAARIQQGDYRAVIALVEALADGVVF